MTGNASRLQPQSPYWYEDLPPSESPLRVEDESDKPDLGLDLNFVDNDIFELSRATSIQRGFGLMFATAAIIGFAIVLPFLARIFTDKAVVDNLGSASVLFVMLIALVVLIAHMTKRCIATPLDLPILFDRNSKKIFALEYLAKPNPFSKWKTVVKEFDWMRVEAEIGKIAGFNGKTYSVRYGLILAQCETNTTKVQDRVIAKSEVASPVVLHQMWAYIRCFMNEGPKNLWAVRPFPRNVSLRRCLLEFYPLLDWTEEGARLRANMHVVELIMLTAIGIPLFWLFLPAGLFEYIGQRLAPKPKWPTEVISQTGLSQRK